MQFYTKETDALMEKYFPYIESIARQKKGCAADYILVSGEVIEAKLDFKATLTGNLFIEFEYTNKDVSSPSGIKLSAERGYTIIIFVLTYDRKVQKILKVPGKDLISFCESSKLRIVDTGRGANGNREGVSSKGYLLPLNKCPENWIHMKGNHD